MDIINNILLTLTSDTRNILYNMFIILWFVSLFVLSLYLFSRVLLPLPVCIISAFIPVTVLIILGSIANCLKHIIEIHILWSSSVLYYVPLLFISTLTCVRLTHYKKSILRDILAISYFCARTLFLPGCMFAGCCHGKYVKWGIYSWISKTTVVPVQEIEFILSLVICICIITYLIRNSYNTKGKCAAWCLITFGTLNMITDIFSVGFPKVVYSFSWEGIYAFLTMCIGLILLFLADNNSIRKEIHNQ